MPETVKQRPKYLNLVEIRLPLPGVTSIMHRISGGVLFLTLPILVYLFQLSLGTPQEFETLKAIVGNPIAKLILLALMWGFIHHFCMGIRILLIDVHHCVELQAARQSAMVVLCVSIPVTLILAVKLW